MGRRLPAVRRRPALGGGLPARARAHPALGSGALARARRRPSLGAGGAHLAVRVAAIRPRALASAGGKVAGDRVADGARGRRAARPGRRDAAADPLRGGQLAKRLRPPGRMQEEGDSEGRSERRQRPHGLIVGSVRASFKPAPATAGAVRARMRPLARAPSRVRGWAPVGRGGRARLKAAVLKTARVESPREFESPPLRQRFHSLSWVADRLPDRFSTASSEHAVAFTVSRSPRRQAETERGLADPAPFSVPEFVQGVVVAPLQRPARFSVSPSSPCHVFAVPAVPAPVESSWQACVTFWSSLFPRISFSVDVASPRSPVVVTPLPAPFPLASFFFRRFASASSSSTPLPPLLSILLLRTTLSVTGSTQP